MALGSGCSKPESTPSLSSTNSSRRISAETLAQVAALEAREQRVAATVWSKELLAQESGRTFESLWNSLNAARNQLHALASFPVGEVVLGQWTLPRALPHGIELRELDGATVALSAEAWRARVEEATAPGGDSRRPSFATAGLTPTRLTSHAKANSSSRPT